ncbi:MAG: hypothetical protein AMXMBFR26_21260 [Porticoccaceae bacterium]
MEQIVNLHIEKLPEGVYLAASDDVPGLSGCALSTLSLYCADPLCEQSPPGPPLLRTGQPRWGGGVAFFVLRGCVGMAGSDRNRAACRHSQRAGKGPPHRVERTAEPAAKATIRGS